MSMTSVRMYAAGRAKPMLGAPAAMMPMVCVSQLSPFRVLKLL